MDRFFIPPSQWGESLALTGEEAHHCRRVMRKRVGDEIEVFNGAGSWARGKITTLGSEVLLEIQEAGETPRAALQIELAVGIPKGKTFDLIIQKSVELGVSAIQPLMTEQGMVRIEGKERTKKTEKWNRLALEACKQCGQNWLPTVYEPVVFQNWFPERNDVESEVIAALREESKPLREVLPELKNASSLRLLVGPEGDFSESEYELVSGESIIPVSLGKLVLKVETASIYIISNVICNVNYEE